jgi:hypothetical protein
MAKYDLTGSLEKDFTFSINGQEYTFRKPTVREARAIGRQFAGVQKETDEDKQMDLSDEAMKTLYQYITAAEGSRPIAEVIEDQTVDVQIAFMEMIQAELGTKKK